MTQSRRFLSSFPRVLVVCSVLIGLLSRAKANLRPVSELSLDGYAFQCGSSWSIGFRGANEVVCMTPDDPGDGTTTSAAPCGIYRYTDTTLEVTSPLTGSLEATHVERVDGVVVSFRSIHHDLVCHSVSLDWSQYSRTNFVGLACPSQTSAEMNSYLQAANHVSLGWAGDVALRSPLQPVATTPSTTIRELQAIPNSLLVVQDLYGVYQWYDNDVIRMYFGPQQGRMTSLILAGRLTTSRAGGDLYLDDYKPPGPCQHDGESVLKVPDLTTIRLSTKFEEDEFSAAAPSPKNLAALLLVTTTLSYLLFCM